MRRREREEGKRGMREGGGEERAERGNVKSGTRKRSGKGSN